MMATSMLPTELDIVHQGVLRAAPLLWRGSDGQVRLTLSVSGRFDLHHEGEATLAAEQDEPDQFALSKPGVDVVLEGAAHAPGGAPVNQLEVGLTIGHINKTLTVTGPRHWVESSRGVVVGAMMSFQKLPLSYERGVKSMLNPAGVGFDPQPGHPLPNIAVRGPGAATMAPGFGPLSAQLRGIMAGLTAAHAAWLEQGLARGEPMPEDLDTSYFQVAPPEQRLESLRDEIGITLRNLHPSYPILRSNLQVPSPAAVMLKRGSQQAISLRCDTLWIDASRAQVKLTWRGVVAIDDPEALSYTPILVGQEVHTTERSVARTLALEGSRARTNTIMADLGPGALGGRSMPFILGTSKVQTSDGTEREEGPPTERPDEEAPVSAAASDAVSAAAPLSAVPLSAVPLSAVPASAVPHSVSVSAREPARAGIERRVRKDTAQLDPSGPALVPSPFKLAGQDEPPSHAPTSGLGTPADSAVASQVETVRDTAELPTTEATDNALPFAPAGEMSPAPTAAATPFSPVGVTAVPPPSTAPGRGLAAPAPLTPTSPATAPPQHTPAHGLPFVRTPPAPVRPPDPLSPSAAPGGVPARLEPIVPEPAPAPPPAPIEPVAPERLGPLARGLDDEPTADSESDEDEAPVTRPSQAPGPPPEIRPSQIGDDEPVLELDRLAAIEAVLHLAEDASHHPAVYERFEVTESQLERARTHHHEQQAESLHRGKRELLDAFDDAYVAQLEHERGPIDVTTYAQLELAIERNNLPTALPELGLVRPAVLPIKRVWMRKLITDPKLAKRTRQALNSARED